MSWAALAEIALTYSDAFAITGLAGYIAYEIRLGALREVRSNQRTLGIGLYRVIKRDEELDEEAFRAALWGEDSDELFFRDLNVSDSSDHEPGD